MIYLSQLLGNPVLDANGERIGVVNDLGIATREVFPRVTSLAFQGPGKTPFMISWRKYVETFDETEVRLAVPATDIRFSYLQPDEVLIARDLLNKQIVDTRGMRVVRVNDLKLSDTSSSQLRLLGAEVGVRGILRGLIYLYTNGAWVENLPKSFKDFASVNLIGSVSVYYCCIIALVIVIHLVLTRTRQGRYFVAVGDNAQGATLVGLPTFKTKMLAYVICAVMASIGGVIFCSRIGFVTPMSGNGYEMKAIAACVLGGISLAGGVGSVIGSAIGAVIMSSISYLLVFMGFSSNYDNAITGIILLVIVVIDAVIQHRSLVKNKHDRLLARVSQDAPASSVQAEKGGEA